MNRRTTRTHPEPIPVMYVANSEKMGGANRVLTDLVRGLEGTRFSALIVAPKSGPLVDWARLNGIACEIVTDGDWNGRSGLVRRAAQLAPLMLRTGTRIVHAIDPLCYRAAGLAGRLVGAARVCQLGFPVGPSQIEWSFRYGPDLIIACYEGQAAEMRRDLAKVGLDRPVVAVPNAVDTRTFTPPGLERDGASRHLRGKAKHTVLIVGHLSEVKGYPTFLRAAAAIASVVRDCAFLALGGETTSPGYGAYLQQLARDLGIGDRVHFLGWQKNVAEVMRAADVMVLPSVVEGLPMAVLEAMSCGRPVVASAVNGTPEAVLHEITGLLIPPNEPAALAAAVVRLLGAPHLARRMGNAGRIRVEEHFSLDKAAAAIQRLYTELLDGGPFTAEKHVRHMTADVDAGLNARVITRELRDSA